MKKLFIIPLLILVFYHLYPQGISFFGYSFIFTSGALGLGLYLYNKAPFPEILKIILAYIPIVFFAVLSAYVNFYEDSYLLDYTKSELAWIFSSYLIVFFFFLVHPKGDLYTFCYYIIAAVLLQCIISVAMYMNPAVNSFFSSLQMTDVTAAIKRADTEGERLLGYGIAFFGAGIVCGFALILLVYILMTKKLSTLQLILLTTVYAAIFYIGLLSARTTLVGAASSIALMPILFFMGKKVKTKQFSVFLLLGSLFITTGYTVSYIYFPEFADWAFEVFINYEKSGELRTHSSDSLESMFLLPQNLKTWMYGTGQMAFWGSDVGYTRLLFYIGLPGTLAYFYYQYMLINLSITKDKSFNATLLIIFVYNIALNIKGLSDLNHFVLLFTFFFLYYKYFIYTPKIYRRQVAYENKLRSPV